CPRIHPRPGAGSMRGRRRKGLAGSLGKRLGAFKTSHKRPPAPAAEKPADHQNATDFRLHITPTETITQACLPTRSPVGFEAPTTGRFSRFFRVLGERWAC